MQTHAENARDILPQNSVGFDAAIVSVDGRIGPSEGQSIAAKILESLGARLDEVRQETLALLGDQYYPRPKKRSQTPVLDEFATLVDR